MFNQSKYWSSILCICVVLGVLLVGIIPVHAAIITVPDGLSLGDQYRLIFVTTTTTHALSGRIDYYDSFVTANATDPSYGDALTNLSVSWKAIVSTTGEDLFASLPYDPGQEVEACYHTETAVIGSTNYPIYNLQGTLVATDNSHLWAKDGDGSHVVGVDRAGDTLLPDTQVWTGTNAYGYGDYSTSPDIWDNRLGCDSDCWWGWNEFGDIFAVATAGAAGAASYDWICSGTLILDDLAPVYALSDPITVVPVPPAIWLLGSALIALLGIRRKGRKP